MFVVDTNVLVYAANEEAPESTVCRALLEEWRTQALPWYLTWSIVYEFLRVITHRHVLSTPWSIEGAWSFVDAILASPSVSLLVPTARHAEVLERTLEDVPSIKGNLLHDAHVAVLMREHGIHRVFTRDADFHRFGFLDVVDPLA